LINTTKNKESEKYMTKEKMTMREFLTAISENEMVEDELKDYAIDRIKHLDQVNEKRKNAPKKPSKVHEENLALAKDVLEILKGSSETFLAKDIAKEIGHSIQKTSAILKTMVEENLVEKIVPSNRNKPMEYKIVTEDVASLE